MKKESGPVPTNSSASPRRDNNAYVVAWWTREGGREEERRENEGERDGEREGATERHSERENEN
jgi:hypothetical protein